MEIRTDLVINENYQQWIDKQRDNQRYTGEEDVEEFADAEEFLDDNEMEISSSSSSSSLTPTPECPTFDQSLDLMEKAITLYLQNDFTEAISLADLHSKKSVYHSTIKSFMITFSALLNMEKNELEAASKSINQTLELCRRLKKSTSFFGSWTKFFWSPNYDDYTDIEVHANLLYAHTIIIAGLAEFLENQTVISLVKAAFRIKAANGYYKEGIDILSHRNNWQSKSSKINYEAGVKLGNGIINFICSILPSSFLKLVRLVGFSGDREGGLRSVHSVARQQSTFTNVAKLIYMALQCYAETIFGIGPDDLTQVEQFVNEGLKQCPNGAWYWFFKAKLEALRGQLDESIASYDKCINSQSTFLQLHYASFWEMSWCYAWKCDWDGALMCSKKLGNKWNLSAATFAFEEAAFLYMKMVDENDLQLKNQVAELFRSVPALTKRYAGRRITGEKIAAESATRFFNNGEAIPLPFLEIAYLWNKTLLIDGNRECAYKIINRIDNLLKNKGFQDNDELAYLVFYKGVCLKLAKEYDEARRCLNEVLEMELDLKKELGIAPQSCLELGLISLQLNALEEAKEWLAKTMHYNNYWAQIVVHMRVHCARRKIREREKIKSEMNESKIVTELE